MTIGLDHEADRRTVSRPDFARPDDDVEHEIDAAEVLQGVVVKVDELGRAEVEGDQTVGRASTPGPMIPLGGFLLRLTLGRMLRPAR